MTLRERQELSADAVLGESFVTRQSTLSTLVYRLKVALTNHAVTVEETLPGTMQLLSWKLGLYRSS